MGKPSLNDDDKDLLQELLGSPGWRVVLNYCAAHELKKHASDVFSYTKRSDGHHAAAIASGKYDGITDFVASVYNAAGFELPDNFKEIRRGI